MQNIVFQKQELKNLWLINNKGFESNISMYHNSNKKNPIFNEHESLLKGMIIKSYKTKGGVRDNLISKEWKDYINNKHQKIEAYSKIDPNSFKYLNIPLGSIYLNNSFWATYQKNINHSITLNSLCYDSSSNYYMDIKAITNFTKQIQQAMKEELHPNDIYTDDLHLGNILVDSSNNIHLIDSDSYKVGEIVESSYYYNNFDDYFSYSDINSSQFNSIFDEIRNIPKYLVGGDFHASRQKDIFSIYNIYIEMITKVFPDELSCIEILEKLEQSCFPYEFIECFDNLFNDNKDNYFIPDDVLDKIKKDYTIGVEGDNFCKFVKLKRK